MSEKTKSRLIKHALHHVRNLRLQISAIENQCELFEICRQGWREDLEQAIQELKIAINRVRELLEE